MPILPPLEKKDIKKLQELIAEINIPLDLDSNSDLNNIQENYPIFKNFFMIAECRKEHKKLLKWFNKYQSNVKILKEEFQHLCANRENNNKGTCLSFTWAPNNLCNTVYFDIAALLFQPKHMGEIIEILLPSVHYHLSFDFNLSAQSSDTSLQSSPFESHKFKEKIKHLKIIFKKEPLENLKKYPINSTFFEHCIINKDIVFDVRNYVKSEFSFELHSKFKEALQRHYPRIHKRLTTYNNEFQALYRDIDLMQKKGITLKTALDKLIQELTFDGGTYTGKEFASNNSSFACIQFQDYLASLRKETKNTVLELKTRDQKHTIKKILDYLSDHTKLKCVETAARELSKILLNKENNPILNEPPILDEEELKKIKQRYYSKCLLSYIATPREKNLPINFIKENIKNIPINDADDYINFIISFPKEYYKLLSLHIPMEQLLIPKFRNFVYTECNEEAKEALFEAVIKNEQNEKKDVFSFILSTTNTTDLEPVKSVLSKEYLNEQDRRDLLTKTTLLHRIVTFHSNTEILEFFLEPYSKKEQWYFISQEDQNSDSAIDYAITNTNQAILDYLIEKFIDYINEVAHYNDDQTILNEYKKNTLDTILKKIARQGTRPQLESILKKHYTQEEFYAIFKNKNSLYEFLENSNILHDVTQNTNHDVFEMLLEKIENNLPFLQEALEQKDNLGCLPLHYAAKNQNENVLNLLLAIYDQNEMNLTDSFFSKTNLDLTPLHFAATNLDHNVIKKLLHRCSDFQLEALDQQNKYHETVLLHAAIYQPKIIHTILDCIKAEINNDEKFCAFSSLLEKKDDLKKNVFNCLLDGRELELFFLILEYLKNQEENLYQDQDRKACYLSYLSETKDSEQRTVFHVMIAYNTDIDVKNLNTYFNEKLKLIPQNNISSVLNQQDQNHHTVLNLAVWADDFTLFKSILNAFPSSNERLKTLLIPCCDYRNNHRNWRKRQSTIQYMIQNSDITFLKIALEALEPEDRLTVLSSKNEKNTDSTIGLLFKREDYKEIKEYFTEAQWQTLLSHDENEKQSKTHGNGSIALFGLYATRNNSVSENLPLTDVTVSSIVRLNE